MAVNVTAQNPLPLPSARTVTISKVAVLGQYVEDYDNNDQPIYRPGFENMGSAEKAELKLTPTKAQAKQHASGISLPLVTAITGLDAQLSLELTQKTPLVKALEIMASNPNRKFTQEAKASTTLDLGKAVGGLNYPLPFQNITVTKVAVGNAVGDAGAVEITEQNYRVDRRSGWVWIAGLPQGAPDDGKLLVTFKAQAITETENLIKFGGLTGTGFRMRLFLEGRNIQGAVTNLRIWDAQFLSEATIMKSNTGSDVDRVALQADLFPATYDNFGQLLDPDDVYFQEHGVSRAAFV